MAQAAFADSAAARRCYQLPFGGVLVVAGLLQLALFAYATAPGLAGTGDSRYYLHAAQTLRATGQLLNPDGTAYRYWPPLYPVLLAAAGSLAGVRVLHAGCLLGSLLLWSRLGKQLLPKQRAQVLPALLMLSTPWLLVGRFVWAEGVFLLLFAAYAAALWQWLRTERWTWWAVATAVGLLMPLQRTLGLFLLAGVGLAVVFSMSSRLVARGRWLLILHLFISGLGGLLWQYYALLVAGPSRYHPSRGGLQLLNSAADYGFVIGRWLLPLPTPARVLLSGAVWAVGLLALFWAMWPRRQQASSTIETPVAAALNTAPAPAEALEIHSKPWQGSSSHFMRQILWSASLALIVLVAALTVFAQSAAGIHDAERYASVLYAPVCLLLLAAWPAQMPRWLGTALVGVWLIGAALRVGRVAHDLHQVPPLPTASFASPGPHGQGVGAAEE